MAQVVNSYRIGNTKDEKLSSYILVTATPGAWIEDRALPGGGIRVDAEAGKAVADRWHAYCFPTATSTWGRSLKHLRSRGDGEMTTQQLSGSWKEIKGTVKEKWGMLTDQDLMQAEGSVEQLIGTIQRKTGESRQSIERALRGMFDQVDSVVRRAASTARDYASAAQERAGEMYERAAGTVREGYEQTEQYIQHNPGQSLAIAFGAGVVAGLFVGVCLRRG
jgi:uncharacterized protein YjbJ (UPF0337 family)